MAVELKIRSSTDFWSGILFIGFGIVAVVMSQNFPMGTAMRMGPGYFPTYLGMLLMVLGAIICGRALRTDGEPIGAWAVRPLLVLGTAIVVFGLMMEKLGFVPALVILIVGSTLAGREFKWVEVLILTAVLIAVALGIFIYGIGLPFRLFWWDY